MGSEGTLHWSWEEQHLTRYDSYGKAHRQALANDVAPTYKAQLERFLQAVREDAPAPVPAASARELLATIDAARSSSRTGRRVSPSPRVSLRPAGMQDARLLLEWRNDRDTRRWSRSAEEITPEEHSQWFRETLAEGSTQLWVAEHEERPVGQVRIGPERGGIAEVHVAIAPAARGRGLGGAVLVQAAAQALAEPRIRLLHAGVKPENAASLRAFERAGFERAGHDTEGFLRLERSPSRQDYPEPHLGSEFSHIRAARY